MSNLLDKASIILTPTAYNNGEALCVKPSDGSGDFDFSRNSAATRVNAQGLVENVQILSSNLVQNGDFSEEGSEEVSNGSFSQEGSEEITNGDFSVSGTPNTSSWTLGWYSNTNNVEIANGKLTLSNSAIESASRAYATNGVNSNNILTTNKFYKLQYDIVENNGATDLKYYSANGSFISVPSVDVGSYTLYIQNTSNSLFLFQLVTSNSSISIDNCSIREVGQDWTLGSGWSIGTDKAVANTTGDFVNLYQNSVFVVGKTYKTTFTIVDYTQGSVRLTQGGIDVSGFQNAVGTYTAYFTATQTSLYMQGYQSFIGSITNISVKEVGQNWDFTSGAFITDIGARLTHTPTAGTITSLGYSPLVVGNNYKMTYEITESISGGIKINSAVNPTMVGTVGVHTKYFEADITSISISRTNSGENDVTITNITIIEITDDTNLPRINYEGFSYQDALGSELIVNGDFSDGSTGWAFAAGWSVVNNQATTLGVSLTPIRQTVLVNGTNRLTFDVVEGGAIVYTNYPTFSIKATFSTVGTHTIDLLSDGVGDNRFLYIYNNGAGNSATIDNVSVKEYLGQEVVPDSGCGSWLFEPQSTNLLPYSEDFSSTYWSWIGNTIVTPNTVISPDGTLNASTVTGLSGTGSNDLRYVKSGSTANNTYTYSVYLKGSGTLRIQLSNGIDQAFDSYITLTSVWQRHHLTGTFNATVTSNLTANLDDLSVTATTYDIWGAQVEQQSYATSYIPTNGEANGVTRNQDVCTNGGSLASINSTEGVLYAEIAALANNLTNRYITISNGGNSYIRLTYTTTSNQLGARYYVNGAFQTALSHVLSDETEFIKVAFKWKENDFALWVNGIEVATDTSGLVNAPNTFNRLEFQRYDGVFPFFGKTKALAVFPYLSDSELQSLTTI